MPEEAARAARESCVRACGPQCKGVATLLIQEAIAAVHLDWRRAKQLIHQAGDQTDALTDDPYFYQDRIQQLVCCNEIRVKEGSYEEAMEHGVALLETLAKTYAPGCVLVGEVHCQLGDSALTLGDRHKAQSHYLSALNQHHLSGMPTDHPFARRWAEGLMASSDVDSPEWLRGKHCVRRDRSGHHAPVRFEMSDNPYRANL